MLFNVPDEYQVLFSSLLAQLSIKDLDRAAIAVVLIPNNDFRQTVALFHDCDQTDKQMAEQKIHECWVTHMLNQHDLDREEIEAFALGLQEAALDGEKYEGDED